MTQLTSRPMAEVIYKSRPKYNGIVPCTMPASFIKPRWSSFALPLIRSSSMSVPISAQSFVSAQPMSLPTGLIFYMDFKYKPDVTATFVNFTP